MCSFDYLVDQMPEEKPRYLMGVGTPENIIESVKRGIDMFDCVIPTREARHGRLYIRKKSGLGKGFYETINISNAKFRSDKTPINKTNLKQYSRAYLYQLFKTNFIKHKCD
jgi:queuine tRNA-ribosyltransferase